MSRSKRTTAETAMVWPLYLLFLIGIVVSFRTATFNGVQPRKRRAVTIYDTTAQTTALRQSKESLQFIVLGGTGDLSMSKILPSLFDLYTREFHGLGVESNPPSFLVQLIARSDWTTSILQDTLMNRLTLPSDSTHYQSVEAKKSFVQRCSYVQVSSYHSAALAETVLSHPTASCTSTSTPSASTTTSTTPSTADTDTDTDSMNNSADTDTDTDRDTDTVVDDDVPRHRTIVYFSLPPAQYLPVLRALHHHPPVKSDRRAAQSNQLELVLEKPVGSDRATAQVVLQVTINLPSYTPRTCIHQNHITNDCLLINALFTCPT